MPPPGQADYRPESYNPYAASLHASASASPSASVSALTTTTSTPASAISASNTTAPERTEEDPEAISARNHDHEQGAGSASAYGNDQNRPNDGHEESDPEDTFNLLPKLRSRLLSSTHDGLGLYTTTEDSEDLNPHPLAAGTDTAEPSSTSAVPGFDPQLMYQAISAYSNTPPIQSQSQTALQSLSSENTTPGTAPETTAPLSSTTAATAATSYFAAEQARRELEREQKAAEKRSAGSKLSRAGTLLSRTHSSTAKASMGSSSFAATSATSTSGITN
ncbi:hypothetical protein KEM56_004478, partial [Ascosphaera pollenicola]